jgi:hypothetical protein
MYSGKHIAFFKIKARSQSAPEIRQPFDDPVPLVGISRVRPGRELRLTVNRQVSDEAMLFFHDADQEAAPRSPAAQDRPEQPVLAVVVLTEKGQH